MSFAFLHPEFIFWMVIPVLGLFYFWQTQRPFEIHWLSERVMERIRAKETTMSLKGRNALFLTAALLLIVAMAQPVLIRDKVSTYKPNVVVAIEMGIDNKRFNMTKTIALKTLDSLSGNNVGIIAYDRALYRVAPSSRQIFLLKDLIRNLPNSAERANRPVMIKKFENSGGAEGVDALLIVSSSAHSETVQQSPRLVTVISDTDGIDAAVHQLDILVQVHRLRSHIPLFYYPLGLAMILILIALSSMSQRRTVPVAAVAVAFLLLQEPQAQAGLLDFLVLKEAKASYERGEYRQSERLYARYQSRHDSPQVRYNRANALLMQGRLKEARYWYMNVYTTDSDLREKTKINLEITLERLAQEAIGKKAKNGEENPLSITRLENKEKKSSVQGEEITRLFPIR